MLITYASLLILFLCSIQQVPNPDLPFLGVHFTPKINGEIWLGPNAILAFSREGYRFSDINPPEFIESISNKGLLKLLSKHWQFGIQETIRNIFLPVQIQQLQRYVPKLQIDDVIRYNYTSTRLLVLLNVSVLLNHLIYHPNHRRVKRLNC